MPLAPGTWLGPYEITAPLGAGGMGEVYRARDTRLGRDVAIKVLPASFSADPERLRRFEQEARAAGALNHPNVLAIYDIGTHDGAPYLVTELLEGETLRERLQNGPLPLRKALDIAIQAARGVGAAHDKGIIHRDLKPANIFLTHDGRVKILDFGLAKLTQSDASGLGETQSSTRTALDSGQTEAGMVLGTAGYMSPEQVRGKPADARSDIFALGTILYEMLSGQRAFEKDSSADTMAAILKEEPPELSGEGKKIPPAVERIVRHCLEKNPAERFQSARDLAFDLESVSGSSTSSTAKPAAAKPDTRRWATATGIAALVALIGIGAFFAGRWTNGSAGQMPTYTQVNFRPEAVFRGRFMPDGTTVIYSAAPEGNTPQLFVHRTDSPAPQPLGAPGVTLLSISSKGELAVLTGVTYINHSLFSGTLARMDATGEAPREILEGVQDADWSPNASGLAIIREVGGKSRLEYPVGNVLYETAGYVSEPRFSPRGDQIAFFNHPLRYDDRGSVDVVDLQGHRKVFSEGYGEEEGLTWGSDGKTLYFGAIGEDDSNALIYAVTLPAKTRRVMSSPGHFFVLDSNTRGSFLVTNNTLQYVVMARGPGAKEERNLSWLDSSGDARISPDGQWLLFSEYSVESGVNYALLWRKTDGSPLARLGEGIAQDISADDKWALSILPTPPMKMLLYPTGAGEKRELDPGKIENYETARFLRDGKRVLSWGSERGKVTRCYVQNIAGGTPQPVTPEGTISGVVSPDGNQVLVEDAAGKFAIYSLGGGPAQPVQGLDSGDTPIQWSADGRSVLTYRRAIIPAQVERVDLATGRRTPVREIAPASLAGVLVINGISMGNDENTYAYYFLRNISALRILEGVK
jgi:Tol biopolymer transport system component